MKLLLSVCLTFCFTYSIAQNQNVGIGTNTPAASAALDVSSISKGVLVPRMTSDQRKQISNAATGLLVFDNTTSSFWFRNSTTWVELVDSTKQPWQKNGDDIHTATTGNVGIGTTNPASKLQVEGTVRARDFIATPVAGGISIGALNAGATRLQGGISQIANGYSYLQSIRAAGTTWGIISLNPDGGNVGIGTTAPTATLHVAGGNTVLNQGLVVDGDNTNAGDGVNLLRFGGLTSGEGIGSKRTPGLYQHSLDLYTGGSRRLSISSGGDVSIGTGTNLGRLTVAGDIVAVNSTVKQKTYSWDPANMTPGGRRSLTWTHGFGYQPIIMISVEKQDGSSYGVAAVYKHADDNTLTISIFNADTLYDADVILRWIVVN